MTKKMEAATYDLTEKCGYWKLNDEELDRNV